MGGSGEAARARKPSRSVPKYIFTTIFTRVLARRGLQRKGRLFQRALTRDVLVAWVREAERGPERHQDLDKVRLGYRIWKWMKDDPIDGLTCKRRLEELLHCMKHPRRASHGPESENKVLESGIVNVVLFIVM